MAAKRPALSAQHSALGFARVETERRSMFNPVLNLTPQKLVTWLNEWRAGHLRPLALLMEEIERRDDMVIAVAPKRYEDVGRLPWDVIIVEGEEDNPDAQRQRAALVWFYNNLRATDVMEQDVRGGFSLLCRQMARAIGHFYAPHEIVWKPAPPVFEMVDGMTRCRGGLTAEFRHVPVWFFERMTDRLKFLAQPYSYFGEPMEDNGWMITVGRGLLLANAIAYTLKRMSFNDWVSYNRDFGTAMLDAITDALRDSDDWKGMKTDLQALFGARVFLHNRGTELKPFETKNSGTATFDQIIERLDKRVMQQWRGGDLATQSGNADAVGANAQQGEADAIQESDAALVTETLNEYVDRFVLQWTFGDAPVLASIRVKPPETENVDRDLKVDQFLVSSGVKLSKSQALERYQRTEATSDDDALASPAPQPSTDLTNEATQAELDQFDNNLLRMYAAAQRSGLRPVATRLLAIYDLQDPAARTAAFEELRADLPDILRVMNARPPAADALYRGFGTAGLNGAADKALATAGGRNGAAT